MTTPPPRWPDATNTPQRWALAWIVLTALVAAIAGVVVGLALC
jgi:hypothetical protein